MIYNFSQINIKLKLINDVCPKKDKNHNINAQRKTILKFNFMDSNPILDEPKVLINSSDLLKNLKHSKIGTTSCVKIVNNYIIFSDLYLPQEVGFDSYFFLQVLSGSKKVIFIFYNFQLLPLGHHSDYNIKYFRKDKILTKEFLINLIQNDARYKPYFPDNAKLSNITRDFLLSVRTYLIFQVIAFVTPAVYNNLYELYKNKEKEKETVRWNNYAVEIQPNLKEKIEQFIPCQK